MRHLRILPILGLALTLGSAPFIDPGAAEAAPKDPKASKAKHKASGGSTSTAPDPNRRATGYRVRMGGATLPGVSASVLEDEVQIAEHRSGTDGRTTISAGRFAVAEVTLSGTGPIPSPLLGHWRALKDGKPRKEDIAVETLDASGVAIYQHRLYSTLPRKLTTSPGKDKWTMTLAVETIDLYRIP